MSVVVFPTVESRRALNPRIVDTGFRRKMGGVEFSVVFCSVCQGLGSGWLEELPLANSATCPSCAATLHVVNLEAAFESGLIDIADGSLTIAFDAMGNLVRGDRLSLEV